MKIDKYFHLYGRKSDVIFEEIPKPGQNPVKAIKEECESHQKCSDCPYYDGTVCGLTGVPEEWVDREGGDEE